MSTLRASVSAGESGPVITLSGEADLSTIAELSDLIAAQLAAGTVSLTIDVSGLEYISSAGLGVLLRTHKRLMGAGGKLRLVNVGNHIFDIFRYSGFDQLFEVQRAG